VESGANQLLHVFIEVLGIFSGLPDGALLDVPRQIKFFELALNMSTRLACPPCSFLPSWLHFQTAARAPAAETVVVSVQLLLGVGGLNGYQGDVPAGRDCVQPFAASCLSMDCLTRASQMELAVFTFSRE